jgi:hypothetical protein
VAGEAAVIMATQLRGNANAKARSELGFEPRWPRWREGFAAVFGRDHERASAAA